MKELIQKFPFGESVFLPIASAILRPNRTLYYMTKGLYEKREADYILRRIQLNDFEETVIVYDFKASPPTYGDFLYVIMIARFFLSLDKKVFFFIIDSDFRKDSHNAYNSDELIGLVDRLLELPNILLKGNKIHMHRICWSEFNFLYKNIKKNNHSLIFFKQKVEKRKPIYNHSFNLLNRLVQSLGIDQISKVPIFKDELKNKVQIKYPQMLYITWGARYSEKWDFSRNTTEDEFVRIYKSLNLIYSKHSIMIVSDEIGCTYFKKLSYKYGFSCIYSKDFSKTFMGDFVLILNSDFFFTLRGGGISTAAIFSHIPYCIIAYPVHETIWKKNGIAVWTQNNQFFKKSDRGLPTDVLY